MLHPELLEFQRRLEAVGIVTALHADHVCVRLPLLTSVRVRYDGTRLTFDARSGAVGRTRGTAATFIASIAAITPSIATGAAQSHLVGIAAFALLAGVFDAIRYVITESAITRVTTLWTLGRSVAVPGALGSGPARPVEPARHETVHAPLHVE
jgi:hypothetical protein